ncbi:MAG: rhodanese-like domain-containing protein [Saprospiraceae bacterium]|nr:rhodanese-like domain-containing protein [Saprospiraceae bacterium]MDW8484042.1 rhodanese-like domain-containing protein [Saprospiraceae bacterium]
MQQSNLSNATLIDVRTPEEYRLGHAEGAINIPLDTIPHRISEIAAMPAPRILYCRSGNRSGMAVQILRQAGVSDVHNGGSLEDVLNTMRHQMLTH